MLAKPLSDYTLEERNKLKEELSASFSRYEKRSSVLDLSRGKPSRDQVSLSSDLFTILSPFDDMIAEDGTEVRNYGGLTGIPEAKRLFSDLLCEDPEDFIIYGNSSLNIMYDLISRAMIHGIDGQKPWLLNPDRKFLCIVPGYDRHFSILESFGFSMISVPIKDGQPDMDRIENAISDPNVLGIFCVPKFANPSGITYSRETVKRFLNLKPAAKDFRIFWDNAYCVHDFDPDHPMELPPIIKESKKAHSEDMFYEFASFSKITFPGASVSALCTSKKNREEILRSMRVATIGYDKINELRHAKYFPNRDSILKHMKKHGELLKPRFDIVLRILEEELGPLKIAKWSTPSGGYFISFDTIGVSAKKIIEKTAEGKVKLTDAGSSFPYHKDPLDQNIRLAPSAATVTEIEEAMHIFTDAVKWVALTEQE